MEPQRLSKLMADARCGSQSAREELIAFHRTFIYQTASRISRRPLDWRNDDELSIALMAFDEAIGGYSGRQGASFLTYAATVIRHRLIDYARRQRRHPPSVPLAASDGEEVATVQAEVVEAWARYEAEQEEMRTAEEIDLLSERLALFGMTFDDLVTASPRHRDTRETLIRVVTQLLERQDLMKEMRRTRLLPIKELQACTGVSRKVLESGRRYIVAMAVIMESPDLPRIHTHITSSGSGR